MGLTPRHFENYCCDLRKKIVMSVVGTYPEEVCGVSDVVMVSIAVALTEDAVPVIQIRYCPWCGAEVEYSDTTTNLSPRQRPFPGDEWKDG